MVGGDERKLKIVADENIPYVREAFALLGEVICCSGREMTAATVAQADVLLVRSVTKVGPELLEGSAVRFVGTATIGTDHVDVDYLKKRGIVFTSAAGSNANSVAEYVITAILVLAQRHGWELQGKTLGIVGVGNIGSKVEKKVRALGMTLLPNDPPLQRLSGDSRYVDFEDVLKADFVTCHVPLTREGPDATYHLFNQARLEQLQPGAVLINSSRGAVVANDALKKVVDRGTLGPVVLDVWENEPQIDMALLDAVSLGSPHIAGYSLDGKVNGTVMLHAAVCEMLGRRDELRASDLLPAPPIARIELSTDGRSDQDVLCEAMTRVYDIERDDRDIRALIVMPSEERGKAFDQLRKGYPVRREAHNTAVQLEQRNESLVSKLELLGFEVL